MSDSVVIVGAGHAGVQCAASLREDGYAGPILLTCDEPHWPYQRPPLSKAFMKRAITQDGLALRGPSFFAEQAIATRFGDAVAAIDREAREVRFASGDVLPYAHLVLATGARARPAPFPGADLPGVVTLRNLDDAQRLREALDAAADIVVIGAGFIGLEFAATAALASKSVTIVEAAPRVMGRAVSAPVSRFFASAHRAFGATLHTHAMVSGIATHEGRLAVSLKDGTMLPADLVVAGIGVLAEDALAQACGLACGDGILVDDRMRTSDPHISAIGDCACHPNIWAGAKLRLESVQNAADQARVVARRLAGGDLAGGDLAGGDLAYAALPWFWSDQGDLKLQIAGLLRDADTFALRGDPDSRAFSVFAFAGETLRAVESVNRGGDHMAARRLLAERIAITPDEAADPAFDLKSRAMRRTAA